MNIYTPDGWLDIPHIAEIADRNNINFVVMIGARQVGKTYGVLKYMLDNDKRFFFMRRVKPELKMLQDGVNSPFEAIEKDRVIFKKTSEYTTSVMRIDKGDEGDTETQIGAAAALSSIGWIRGFNGQWLTDLVFDEFIPEEHLYHVPKEGDAFLNAVTTVNGNRELLGKPHIRCWLLANSNSLDSDILRALNLVDVIEMMKRRDLESFIDPDRGCIVLLPKSSKIITQRKRGGLYRMVNGSADFAKMAYDNEFSYDDDTNIKAQPLIEYRQTCALGELEIWISKGSPRRWYVTRLIHSKPLNHWTNVQPEGLLSFWRQKTALRSAYLKGKVYFQDTGTKQTFLSYLHI